MRSMVEADWGFLVSAPSLTCCVERVARLEEARGGGCTPSCLLSTVVVFKVRNRLPKSTAPSPVSAKCRLSPGWPRYAGTAPGSAVRYLQSCAVSVKKKTENGVPSPPRGFPPRARTLERRPPRDRGPRGGTHKDKTDADADCGTHYARVRGGGRNSGNSRLSTSTQKRCAGPVGGRREERRGGRAGKAADGSVGWQCRRLGREGEVRHTAYSA